MLFRSDAKKDKFYATAYKAKECILKAGDYEISEITDALKNSKEIIVCGPDAKVFIEAVKKELNDSLILNTEFDIPSTESLFAIAEKMIEGKEKPLSEYEGPEYMRASEAEENLKK